MTSNFVIFVSFVVKNLSHKVAAVPLKL